MGLQRMNKLTIKQQLMRQNNGSYIIQNSTKNRQEPHPHASREMERSIPTAATESLTTTAPEWNNLVFLTPAGGPMYNKLWRNTIVT